MKSLNLLLYALMMNIFSYVLGVDIYIFFSSLVVVFRDLKSITGRQVGCYMISCKDSVNIDRVIDWLIKHSKH